MSINIHNKSNVPVDIGITNTEDEPSKYVSVQENSKLETHAPSSVVRLFVKSNGLLFYKGYIPTGTDKSIIINADAKRVTYNDQTLPNDLENFACKCEDCSNNTNVYIFFILLLFAIIGVGIYLYIK